MVDAHLSYLAIISERPDTLADFYQTYFGLSVLGRSPAGDVSMTHGLFNLTFLKRRPDLGEADDRLGPHHFALAVDDIREIEARLKEFAPAPSCAKRRAIYSTASTAPSIRTAIPSASPPGTSASLRVPAPSRRFTTSPRPCPTAMK